MTTADDLLRLAALGADALDQQSRYEATIAEQAALLQRLQHPARFPGDPGPGKVLWGAAVGGNASPAAHEAATERPLPIRRRYWSKVADLSPTGPIVKAAAEDHAAGRLPWLSLKLPWADAAAGKYDAAIDGLLRALDGLGKPVWLIVNHEPEDDGGDPAQWRAMQRRIRDRMTSLGTKNVSFGGCLMSWTFDPRSRRNPDDWWPGNGVWDWAGADHYTETKDPVDSAGWTGFIAWCKTHDIPPAVPEWGVRREDPNAAAKVRRMHELCVQSGVVAAAYFDSNLNSSGTGWTLAGDGLAAWREIMAG